MNVASIRIDRSDPVRLGSYDPAALCGLDAKSKARDDLVRDVGRLAELQDVFYADGRYALLIVVQGVDAAGKDGVIKHVMSGVNPQGVDVYSFKAPSAEERLHDYLWRAARVLPARGRIGIFNRSYYEDVLVTRAEPAVLETEWRPAGIDVKELWEQRYRQIRDFERSLVENGTVVLKFFLHVSRKEQARRLLERIERPAKNWKFSADDVRVPLNWDAYMAAYEEMLANTSVAEAPWYVVPADRKWVTRAVVATVVVAALERLNLRFPPLAPEQRAQIDAIRRTLKSIVG